MGCHMGKNLPVSENVLVLGSSGSIGKATVYQLKKIHVNVTAGMRDISSKEAQEFVKDGIKVLQIDMTEEINSLAAKIQGFESVFINTPGHIDRAKIALNAAKAVKEAGTPQYLLVVSVPTVGLDVKFGEQFKEIEDEVKKLGITYGFIRLPMFMDNILGQAGSITKHGTFSGPIPGNVQFTTVAISDVAAAAAEVLSHYSECKNQTFQITSDKKSYDELAQEFSVVLEKPVKYIYSGYEETKKSYQALGYPEWMADGILELYKLAEIQDPSQTMLTNSFKEITGNNPTSTATWIKQNAVLFGGEAKVGVNSSGKQNKIIVLGASGNIGIPAVKALAAKKANVTAGVRDPTKDNLRDFEQEGVKIIKIDMNQSQAELAAVLVHYNTLYIVTPGSIDRTKLTIKSIQAAKEANITYVLIVSIPTAGNDDLIFGKQFGEIEEALITSGLNYGILRLPLFIDNAYGHIDSISTHDTFYGPIEGNKKFTSVNVEDAGNAAAEILTNPEQHKNKTYTITSESESFNDMAKSFSTALGREIKYVDAGYEATQMSLLKFIPQWQVDGILQLYKQIEKGDPAQCNTTDDYKKITGKNPTPNQEWMKKHAVTFTKKSA